MDIKISQTTELSKDFEELFSKEKSSDVTLVVAGEEFHCHRIILTTRSNYFKAFLYGGMQESRQNKIQLPVTHLPAFKNVLRYIYTGCMSIDSADEEILLEILRLASQYGLADLGMSIQHFLQDTLNTDNVFMFLEIAQLRWFEDLEKACFEFMDKNAATILKHGSFVMMSLNSLRPLLERDSFVASKMVFLSAIESWMKANPGLDAEQFYEHVRLNLIPNKQFATDDDAASEEEELNNAILVMDENVATRTRGTVVINGKDKNFMLEEDNNNFTWTMLKQPLFVKLGDVYTLNCIRIRLYDLDKRSFSYYVEVSSDKENWIKIIDFQSYLCRSWQDLYFESQPVGYIRIVGTDTTSKKKHGFQIMQFEAYCKTETEKIKDGFIFPRENVAKTQKGAVVVEGDSNSDSPNVILGDQILPPSDKIPIKCTRHIFHKGSIIIQLNQPYMIDSMLLCLLDRHGLQYSYYVQISGNMRGWKMINDKRNELCKAGQLIFFEEPRPVVFIKITGTRNNLVCGKRFQCTHFECPLPENVCLRKNKIQTVQGFLKSCENKKDIEEAEKRVPGDENSPPQKRRKTSDTEI